MKKTKKDAGAMPDTLAGCQEKVAELIKKAYGLLGCGGETAKPLTAGQWEKLGDVLRSAVEIAEPAALSFQIESLFGKR